MRVAINKKEIARVLVKYSGQAWPDVIVFEATPLEKLEEAEEIEQLWELDITHWDDCVGCSKIGRSCRECKAEVAINAIVRYLKSKE